MREVFIFISGMVVGGAAVYYEMSKRETAEYEDVISAEDMYEKKAVIDDAKNEGVYEEAMDNMTTEQVIDRINEIINNEQVDNPVSEYNELTKEYKKQGKGINYAKVHATKEEKADSDMPYLIGQMEYDDENNLYDKEVFFYYPEDGVVADQNDTPLDKEDVETLIDSTGYCQFDDLHEDGEQPSIFYVRNDPAELDVMIYWMHGDSFEDLMTASNRT